MDPITVLLATLLTAAAADQSEQRTRRPRRLGEPREPDPPPELPEASMEALELLGEAWPESLTEADFAWMDLMEALGHKVVSWNHEQLAAFRNNTLMCPLGHTDITQMEYMTIKSEENPLFHSKASGEFIVGATDRDIRDELGGIVICKHPGHSPDDHAFWFPEKFDTIWE
jgi:hypothetical protein